MPASAMRRRLWVEEPTGRTMQSIRGMPIIRTWIVTFVCLAALLGGAAPARAQGGYERQMDTAPREENIGGGYVTPAVQRPVPRAPYWRIIDIALLASALALAYWFVIVLRSRPLSLALSVACLAYFGFWRLGCVCPIGAVQNVSVALSDAGYAVPIVVIVFFVLPLVAALLFGRLFCGGACPLGAIQEVVLLRPVQVPRRLDRALGSFKYLYLVAAVVLAVGVGTYRDFIICRFDPFVGFFRMNGPAAMLVTGAVILVVGVFVGRPYCRYLCPYGALLAVLSRVSWRGVSITPDAELDCGLCVEACPYGAIENMRAKRSACLCCGRCYAACPRDRVKRGVASSDCARCEHASLTTGVSS